MDTLGATLNAIGDPTRRAILEHLMGGEKRLSDLAEPFSMSQTGVTKHVRILSDAGLVAVEKRGRVRHCRLQALPMREVQDWINQYEEFWRQQLVSLEEHLSKKKK